MGRTNLYIERVQPRFSEIKTWCENGASNREIAEALGVGYSNFSAYIKKYPELKDLLDNARISKVLVVKEALMKRCLGFTYEEKTISMRKDEDGETKQFIETKVKYEKPDVSAIAIYLRNYDPTFRDRDKATYDFKEMELELRKMIVENQTF